MTEINDDSVDVGLLDHESMEDLRASAARALNNRGAGLIIQRMNGHDSPEIRGGTFYESGDQSFVLTAENRLYRISDEGPELIDANTALETYSDVLLQHLEDADIMRTRDHLAHVLSAIEPDLEIALRHHLAFKEGKIEPIEKEGITFYAVEEDRGIRTYMGMKDGLKYLLQEKVSCVCGKCTTVGEYVILDETMQSVQAA